MDNRPCFRRNRQSGKSHSSHKLLSGDESDEGDKRHSGGTRPAETDKRDCRRFLVGAQLEDQVFAERYEPTFLVVLGIFRKFKFSAFLQFQNQRLMSL